MATTNERIRLYEDAFMPRVLRPWITFVANLIGLAVNIVMGVFQAGGSGRYGKLADICATVDGPATLKVAGPPALVVAAAIVVVVVAGLSVLLTLAWCVRKRRGKRPVGPAVGTAVFLVGFAVVNVLLAYAVGLSSLDEHVTCPPSV